MLTIQKWRCLYCKKNFDNLFSRDIHRRKHPKFWDDLLSAKGLSKEQIAFCKKEKAIAIWLQEKEKSKGVPGAPGEK